MTFALDLQRFAEKAQDNASDAVGGIVVGIARELDKRSPVGDASLWQSSPPPGYVGGRFRGNWQLGVNVRPTGETGIIDSGPKGAAGGKATSRIEAAIPEEALGNMYYLGNNVPHAGRLEMGHSKQAPAGVVGLTVARFQQIVREEVEEVE